MDGKVQRWTIRHHGNIEPAHGYWFGLFFMLFPIPHFLFLSNGIYATLFQRTGQIRGHELVDLAPMVVFWLLSLFFIYMGFLFFRNTLKSRSGNLETIIEMTDTKLTSFDSRLAMGATEFYGYYIVHNSALEIQLDSIRQIVVSDPSMEASGFDEAEFSTDKKTGEPTNPKSKRKLYNDSSILVRGPKLDEILLGDLERELSIDLARRISIAIEKLKYRCQLIEIKQGEKPPKLDRVDLCFGEPDYRIQPADSVVTVERKGKSNVYYAGPDLSGGLLIGIAGWLGTFALGIAMVLTLFSESSYLYFFFWAIPIVPCLGLALWGTFRASETTSFKTSPGRLVVHIGFLLGRKKFELTSKDIVAIEQFSEDEYFWMEDDMQLVVSLAIRLANGERLNFLPNQATRRDLSWLANALSTDVFGAAKSV